MKSILKILMITIAILVASCEKDAVDVELSASASATTVNVGEQIIFFVQGNAENYAIYTGDEGHEFAKSFAVVTEGKDIDNEIVVLDPKAITSFEAQLRTDIASHNLTVDPTNNDLVIIDADAAIAAITNQIADIEFTNAENAKFQISLILPGIDAFGSWDLIMDNFTNLSEFLAPDGGFSTGFPINRNFKEFTYVYTVPGTYLVTVIGSDLSEKNYSGNGAKDNATASSSDYNYSRETVELNITVN